jgi:diguanylate cyclase (GGDEF)-like protein
MVIDSSLVEGDGKTGSLKHKVFRDLFPPPDPNSYSDRMPTTSRLSPSSYKISDRLLSSLKIIKQTTDDLLHLKHLTNEIDMSDSLRELLSEINKLESLMKDDSFSIYDISLTLEAQTHLEFMAFYDSLTKLPNRSYFEKLVQNLIDSAVSNFFLIFIDVDDFKEINDTYGHECGDHLLKCIAQRIKSNLREKDIVSRYGGDEFVALIHQQADVDIHHILDRLIQANKKPFAIKNHHIRTTLSFGAAEYPTHGQTIREVLSCADKAMYSAKQSGKNAFSIAAMTN